MSALFFSSGVFELFPSARAESQRGASGPESSRSHPGKTLLEFFKRTFSGGDGQSRGKRRRSSHDAKFSSSEILAINLTEEAARTAGRLGFKVAKHTNLPSLGVSVAQLNPPKGMDTVKASEYLRAQLPGQDFSLNQNYRLYQAATGSHEPPEGVVVSGPRRASKQEACIPREHCYGSSMIRWNADIQSCARGVKVGVIDTGVDLDHPTFSEHKVIVTHVLPDGQVPAGNWHGTGVLAMLAGDPLSGTPGLIPDARIYMADVFFPDSEGFPMSNTMAMLRALDLMERYEVEVVNMSVSGPADKQVRKAIERMAKRGVIFVAAAGNEGPAAPAAYPAAYPPVIAVTAVDSELRSYRYANRGPYVSVSAPGVKIWTALPNAKEGYQSGTSFAAPYVTAIAAALYPQMPDRKGGRNKETMLKLFNYRRPSEPGARNIYGRGLIMAPEVIVTADGRCLLKAAAGKRPQSSTARSSLQRRSQTSPKAYRRSMRPAGE
jgi:minor extracellular protease Epr